MKRLFFVAALLMCGVANASPKSGSYSFDIAQHGDPEKKSQGQPSNEIPALVQKYGELMQIIKTDTTERGFDARRRAEVIRKKLTDMDMCVIERRGNNFTNQPSPDLKWVPCDSDPGREDEICRIKGEIFAMAAGARDHGMPPETAYDMASGYLNSWTKGITKDFMKTAINTVYFDANFVNAGGSRFARQMQELCLTGGKPRYQPLK